MNAALQRSALHCFACRIGSTNKRSLKSFKSPCSLKLHSSDISRLTSRGRSCRRRAKVVSVQALVAFDYAQPALWLGTALIGGGVGLYNLRNVQPVVAKDSDVVLSCILVFSGGILIFQGWRLDPLLLFVQICLAGTAFTWALEAIKLRKDLDDGLNFESRGRKGTQLQDSRRRDANVKNRSRLPAPAEDLQYGRWFGDAEQGSELEDAQPASARGFYNGPGQQSYYSPASTSYPSYEPSEERGYADAYQDQRYPSEQAYPRYSRTRPEYGRDVYSSQSSQQYDQMPEADRREEGWEAAERRSFRHGEQDQYYNDVSNNFRPSPRNRAFDQDMRATVQDSLSNQGPPEAGSDQTSSNNSRVVDEVENFYNRPESVVEDVQKFYDTNGQQIAPPKEELQDSFNGNEPSSGKHRNQRREERFQGYEGPPSSYTQKAARGNQDFSNEQ